MRTLNIIVSSLLLGAVSCAFPADFAWGVATASYQIEGAFDIEGKGRGIWDDFCDIPGRVANGDSGKVADDFYHKYQEDIDMMVTLGFKSFRMSLSWPRILPDGTIDNINWQGVDFYNRLFDALLAAGIEPFVTLYHWDLPSGLMKNKSTDGWLNADIQDAFNDYADFVFKTFGSKVTKWITFNEPQSFTWLGYGVGIHAPGRCSDYMSKDCSWVADGGNTGTEPYITAHNVILAHAKAVNTYRTKYQKEQGGVIGMCTQSEYGEPSDPNSQDDIDAVDTKVQFEFAWYNDPLYFGKYPDVMVNSITGNRLPTFTDEESQLVKGSFDFLGLNHYTSKYVHYTGVEGKDYSNDGRFYTSSYNLAGDLIGPFAQSSWLNVYPQGLRKLLVWIDKRYNHQPIYIFENGVSVPGETQLPIDQAVHDDFRTNYYSTYIGAMQQAMEEDGVDVRGYFAWSLMDNFEWGDGYNVRFGMVFVDYKDQTRYIKDSAYWYSDWIKNQTTPAVSVSAVESASVSEPLTVFTN